MLQRSPAMEGSPFLGGTALLYESASQAALIAGGMAAACGTVLVFRRIAGAFGAAPGPETVLAICVAGLALVAGCDLASRLPAARASGPAATLLPAMLARVGLIMGVAAVGLPVRTAWSLDALATTAAFVVSLAAIARGPIADRIRVRLARGRRSAANRDAPAAGSPLLSGPLVPAAAPPRPLPHDRAWEGGPSSPAGSLVQRFERMALAEGAECVRGRLCVAIVKGARSGYGHVGFCPPLASQPTVDVTTDYDGVEAVVSAAEVLPWGVRVECRLDEPAEETIEIPVDVLATTAA